MDVKSVFASKTMWVNISALIAAVAGYATGEVDLAASATAAVMAILNIVLRFFTRQPVVA